STDDTAAIASQYDVRLIRTPNRGLSSARNTGLAAATGEIVAYLDDDAYPDPHWLTYLAATFLSTSHVGVGRPNIAPAGDGPIAGGDVRQRRTVRGGVPARWRGARRGRRGAVPVAV